MARRVGIGFAVTDVNTLFLLTIHPPPKSNQSSEIHTPKHPSPSKMYHQLTMLATSFPVEPFTEAPQDSSSTLSNGGPVEAFSDSMQDISFPQYYPSGSAPVPYEVAFTPASFSGDSHSSKQARKGKKAKKGSKVDEDQPKKGERKMSLRI